MNQWYVASMQPPHLAAICVWEGAADYYRDLSRHGGILSTFLGTWFNRTLVERQYGYGDRGARSWVTGELVAGPATLPDDVLAKNRIDPGPEVLKRPLDGDYYRERSPEFDKIKVPLLSAANWGGIGLHPRGNFEGYLAAASKQKWLQVHGDSHFSPFYRADGETLQKRFFGHFLKGENTGWDKQPPVQLHVRHPGEKFVVRDEQEWPLARTQWTKFYLDPASRTLGREPKSRRRHRLRNHRRRRELRDAGAGARDGNHRAGGGQALCLVGHDRRRPLPRAARCSIRTARRFSLSAPTILACRSASAGCAPRSASSMPSAACRTGRIIRTMKAGR